MARKSTGKMLPGWLPIVLIVVIAVAAVVVIPWGGDELVVYCAHDSVYSESVLNDFEEQTGIPVAVKFDTEATKSLGLIELLIREKENPRCDVFWNNELLGTMDLKTEGVLQPYKGPGYERIPAAFKDPEGYWAGFGARLRVYIVNTDRMEATPEAVEQAMQGDLSRVAMAKPLYGTTLTHYSVLWDLWGGERLKEWHAEVRERDLREVMGNAQAKDLVAEGVCDLGFTDTDDFFLAKDVGKPVEAVPVRVGDGATICIPNTVSIIEGSDNVENARKLVDYLLSRECETGLANAKSRQVPLGPVDPEALPEEVRQFKEWADDGYPLDNLGPARDACLAWLKAEYVE